MLKTITVIAILFIVLRSHQIRSLSSSDFDLVLSENPLTFVMFYSPNCPHCKTFMPEFDQLPQKIEGMQVMLGKVNCVDDIEVCSWQDIQGYPMLALYDHKTKLLYSSGRTADQIVAWIKNYNIPRVKAILNDDIEGLSAPYFLYSGEQEKTQIMIKMIAFGIDYVPFYQIRGSQNKISIVTKTKEQKVFSGEQSVQNIQKWLVDLTLPIVVPLSNRQLVDKYLISASLPTLFIVLHEDDSDHNNKDILEEVCEEQKDIIYCGYIEKKNEIYKGAHDFLRQDGNNTAVSVVKDQLRVAFVYPFSYQELTKQKLKVFIQGALEDTIDPVFDDRAPTQVKFKEVKLLNGEQVDEFVKSNDNVFINFYSPKEEASLTFSLRYEILAEQVKEEKDLDVKVIAVDCEVSEEYCKQKLVTYYPTLRLYIKGISIQFERTKNLPQVPDLYSFINSRMKNTIKQVADKQQVKDLKRPFILFYGPQMNDVMQAFPKVSNYKAYFMKTQGDYQAQLYKTDGSTSQYEGNLYVRDLQVWISLETLPVLSDLLEENPDERIINAVQNKKIIIFMLDVDQEKRQKNRQNLGQICKNLKQVGGYASAQHQAFESLVSWIGLEKGDVHKSMIIFADIGSDKKYLYPGEMQQISEEKLKDFNNKIKSGEVEEIIKKASEPVVEEEPKKEEPEVIEDL